MVGSLVDRPVDLSSEQISRQPLLHHLLNQPVDHPITGSTSELNARTICTAAAHRGTTEHFSRTTFHPRPVCGSQLCGRNFMLPSPHSFECFAFLFPALVSSALIFLYFVMRVKKCRSFGVSSVFFLWQNALKENLQEDTETSRTVEVPPGQGQTRKLRGRPWR